MNYITWNISSEVHKEKLEFFLNYFNLTNNRIGKLPGFELETYNSLFRKIEIQIKQNYKEGKYFISELFNHELIKDPFFTGFKGYENINNLIKSYSKLSTNRKKEEYLQNKDTLNRIDTILSEINTHEIDNLFENLNQLLLCQHPLDKHKERIKFYTKLLVSHFRMNNFNRNETYRILMAILRKDKINFPLPDDILEYKGTNEFINKRDEYLRNVTPFDRIEAFKPLFKRKYEFSFIFVINDLIPGKNYDLKWKWENVEFIGVNNPDYENILLEIKKSIYSHIVLDLNPICIGIVTGYYSSLDQGKEIAKKSIQQALTINSYPNATIEESICITLRDNQLSSISISPKEENVIDNRKLKELEDRNPRSILNNTNEELKSKFLNHESIFHLGIQSEDIQELWKYLEYLFPNYKGKYLKSKVVKLISDIEKELILDTMNNVFYLLLSNLRARGEELGISIDEQTKLYNKHRLESDNFSFEAYRAKIVKDPFLKDLVELYDEIKSEHYDSKIRSHIEHILTEANSYRNILTHLKQIDWPFKNKLIPIFPMYVRLVRVRLIQLIADSEKENYRDLIKDI